MKKYLKPIAEINVFLTEDIITTSSAGGEEQPTIDALKYLEGKKLGTVNFRDLLK